MTTWTVPAQVMKVIDGDTFKLCLDLGWHITLITNVRVDGIDAPELSTAEGQSVKSFVSGLCPVGTWVTFTSNSLDKYGRPLGDIQLPDGQDLGETLLWLNYARPYHGGKR